MLMTNKRTDAMHRSLPLQIRKAPNLQGSGLKLSCRWPDSNRHGFPLDFESSASANSATAA